MRVLFISTRDPRRRYRFLLEPLREIGVDVDLFDGAGSMRSTLPKVIRRLRASPPSDVLILTGSSTRNFIWFLVARLLTRTRIVLRFGGDPLEVRNAVDRGYRGQRSWKTSLGTFLSTAITRCLLKRVDAVVVVSDNLLQSMRPALGERVRTLVLPPTLKQPAPAEGADALSSPDDCVNLLTVTNLKYHEKAQGVMTIARAVEQLSGTTNAPAEIRYDVLGGGHQLEFLQQSLAESGLLASGRIHLHGRLDNVADYYRHADIFVYCSTLDGYPLVLCEAQSFGLPIVANRWGAFPDMLNENRDALFFDGEDVDALAAALIRLIEDKSMRVKMGEAAARNFKERHSSIECGNRLQQFLQSLI